MSNDTESYIKEIIDTIREYLNKRIYFSINITSLIQLNDCPFKALSGINKLSNFFSYKPSISLWVGSISHQIFDSYYDEKYKKVFENNDFDEIFEIMKNKNIENKISFFNEKIDYAFLKKNYEKIKENVEKHYQAFLNYSKDNPIPFRRELYLKFGILRGVIDRIDKFGNYICLRDYKTTASYPNDEMLMKYKLQVAGAYQYLIRQSKLAQYKLLPSRIDVIKRKSFETIVVSEQEMRDYLEEFEAILYEFGRFLLKIRLGKIKTSDIVKEKDICRFCFIRNCIYSNSYSNNK